MFIDYLNQEYFDYKNNYPNIYSTLLKYNSLRFFNCVFTNSIFDFNYISNLLNKKKNMKLFNYLIITLIKLFHLYLLYSSY